MPPSTSTSTSSTSTSTTSTSSSTTSTSTTTTLRQILIEAQTKDFGYPPGYTPGITTRTNVLRLYKPIDDDEDWGDEFRQSMDIIDMSVSVVRLMNRSGLAVIVGTVVVMDLHEESFQLTTTAYSEEVIGITLDPLQTFDVGLVKVAGFVRAVRITGSVSIGDFLYTSATAGLALASSAKRAGAFARALSEPDSNSYVKAVLLPGIADSPLQVLRVRIPSTVAGATFEKSVVRGERACEIVSAYFVTDSNVVGNDTNYATLSLLNKTTVGTVCSYAFTLGEDATAFVPVSFGALDATHKILASGSVITLEKTEAVGGLALPAFVLQLTYDWTG